LTLRTAATEGWSLRESVFGATLFLVALAPRLGAAIYFRGEAVWDGHYYDFGAKRIAAGLGYSEDRVVDGITTWHAWCHYPVGYSAFLAFFYRLFGPSMRVAGLANATVGAALAVVTWLLARHGLSRARARIAGVFVAIHPGMILYAALVMSEPLAALLTLVAFLLAVRDPRPWRGVVWGALALGVAALVRPQALLCAPFLALVVPSADTSRWITWRRRGLAAVCACAIALLPVLPWTARNHHVMDGTALVSTNAGWNLAIGAFPRATGRFEALHSSDGCAEVTGQVQQDRCWLSYGVNEIRKAPGRWLALIPAKLGFTFDHESFEVEYLHESQPALWSDARREHARDLVSAFHRALLCAAALGCVAYRLRGSPGAAQGVVLAIVAVLFLIAVSGASPTFWPLAVVAAVVPWLPLPGRAAWPPALLLPVALLGTTIATHAIFFGEDRYHVVVTPVLALLAAAALRSGEPKNPAPVVTKNPPQLVSEQGGSVTL
jgi:4-amino-4-deoxy-L-arabinose transferase-like glycosyltransferase